MSGWMLLLSGPGRPTCKVAAGLTGDAVAATAAAFLADHPQVSADGGFLVAAGPDGRLHLVGDGTLAAGSG